MNIGKAIKEIRKNLELNQGEFAKTIGITQAYLSGIESNNKKPSTDLLEKIAKTIEVPLPIIFWFGIEESDVKEGKIDAFNYLKPSVDNLLNHFI